MADETYFTAPVLHGAFMAGCVVALALVYVVPWFDLRSLKRMALKRMRKEGDDSQMPADLLDRADLGALLNLLIIVGTGLAMLVGWRVPAEIERIYGSGASFGLLFPSVEMTTLGKGAQVVGAICLGLVALRLLRILVVFAAAGMAGVSGVAALNYVFDLNVLGLL